MKSPIALEEPGRVLAGRYRVEGTLGAGGMGVVYLVTDLECGEPAALKVLDATRHSPKMLQERFAREIAAVQRLTSRHAVRLLDAGTLADGRHFMSMEYLRGEDLQAMLRREGSLAPARAVGYILEACAAIGEAHALGIVHRDLKPANLFVALLPDGGECVKVLDFGISKLPQETIEELSLTATGTVLGSPVYMSPEQMTSSRRVDARSDIWSLGIVLYRLVSGTFPYEAEGMPALCAKVLTDEPRRLADVAAVSPALDAAVMRCLARDPALRFASAVELAEVLGPLVGATTPSVSMPVPPVPPARRPRRLIWLAGGLVGLAVGAGYLWSGPAGVERQPSPTRAIAPPAPAAAAPSAPAPAAPAPTPAAATADAAPAAPAEADRPAPRPQTRKPKPEPKPEPKRERRPPPRGDYDSPLPP